MQQPSATPLTRPPTLRAEDDTPGAAGRLRHWLMRWNALEVRLARLPQGERSRFYIHTHAAVRQSVLLLMFAMPLLFLADWGRDFAQHGDLALPRLPQRLAMTALTMGWAGLLLFRGLQRHWQEVIGTAYLCLYGLCMAVITIQEPERLSMLHVVAALMLIIWLRVAVRPSTIAGVTLVLCLPLAIAMFVVDASPGLWLAYALYCTLAIWIGLTNRSLFLENWLDLYLLRQRLLERLHEDSLTGVSNREAWEATGTRTHRRTMDNGVDTCVIFFDLDHFKSINDRHGHAVGDAVLQEVSKVMKRNLRAGELLARLGGEEFVAMLPSVAMDDAVRIADRIRTGVQALCHPVPVTLSAGVAQALPDEPLEALTARADAAMLEAKRSGRNRIVRA